jgi:hypothetical protein
MAVVVAVAAAATGSGREVDDQGATVHIRQGKAGTAGDCTVGKSDRQHIVE